SDGEQQRRRERENEQADAESRQEAERHRRAGERPGTEPERAATAPLEFRQVPAPRDEDDGRDHDEREEQDHQRMPVSMKKLTVAGVRTRTVDGRMPEPIVIRGAVLTVYVPGASRTE